VRKYSGYAIASWDEPGPTLFLLMGLCMRLVAETRIEKDAV